MSFDVALAEEIWTAKYRFRTDEGKGDSSFAETARRVARAVAAAETPELRGPWEERFRQAIEDFRFIPAGRVLAGAGTDRSVTLFNCFVMGIIPDSLEGIFEHLKEAALTMQQGGGVGMDFSTIRTSKRSSTPNATLRGSATSTCRSSSPMPSWPRSEATPTGRSSLQARPFGRSARAPCGND